MQNRPIVRWLVVLSVLVLARAAEGQSWQRGPVAAGPSGMPRQLAPQDPSWQRLAGSGAVQGVPTPADRPAPAGYLGVSPAAAGPASAGSELARRLQQARQSLRPAAPASAAPTGASPPAGVSHRRHPQGVPAALPSREPAAPGTNLRSVLSANAPGSASTGAAAGSLPAADASPWQAEGVGGAGLGATAQVGDLPPADAATDTGAPSAPTEDGIQDGTLPGRLSFGGAPAENAAAQLAPIVAGQSSRRRATSGVPAPASQGLADEPAGASLLLSHESPRLAVQTTGPKTMVVGRPAGYEVTVVNEGESAAREVQVQVLIPDWAEISEAQAAGGSVHSEPDQQGHVVVRWSLPRIESRAQEKLKLEIVPRGSRPLDLQVTWTFTPPASMAHIQVQEPKLAMSLLGPQDVLYGETKVYTIELSNPGTGDAENVVLRLLPLQPGDPAPGERSLGVLKAGERKSIEIELTAQQAGQLQVRASATAAGGLECQASREVLVRRANLEVQIDGPEMEFAGTHATYTIQVSNTGDAPASGVVTSVVLPDGAQHVASSEGAVVSAEHRQVAWTVGMLAPGAVRVLELTCLLSSPGENRLDVRTRGEPELVSVQSIATHVEALADLQLVVNDPRGAVPVGTEAAYEVRVINRGTKAAENIHVLGYFSEGIEPTGVSGWQGSLAEGQVQLEPIPRLGPGQEMAVKIHAQALRPGSHVFQAELDCSNPETHLVHQESTRFYGDAPVATPGSATPRTAAAPGTPPRRLDLRR